MAIFNIDEDVILGAISESLDSIDYEISSEQATKIANAINDSFPGVIELLTYGMQEHWKQEARDTPTGWGQKYANAIKAKVTGNIGEIWVDENMIDKTSNKPSIFFARMVEEGMKSFSIKEGLLKSEKAKVSSDGIKYIVVPFPVATPRKENQGNMASKFSGREMTKEAHDIVKNGGKYTGKLKSGQEVSGLTRYVTQQRHEQYGMFLCVSEKSDGWIHPGVAPTPVFQGVLDEINKRTHDVISEFCKSIVKEFTSS